MQTRPLAASLEAALDAHAVQKEKASRPEQLPWHPSHITGFESRRAESRLLFLPFAKSSGISAAISTRIPQVQPQVRSHRQRLFFGRSAIPPLSDLLLSADVCFLVAMRLYSAPIFSSPTFVFGSSVFPAVTGLLPTANVCSLGVV